MAFTGLDEAFMAYLVDELSLHAPIKMRVGELAGDPAIHSDLLQNSPELFSDEPVDGDGLTETTLGRALVQHGVPRFVPLCQHCGLQIRHQDAHRGAHRSLRQAGRCQHPRSHEGTGLPPTRPGPVSRSVWRTSRLPPNKKKILRGYEKQAERYESQYQKGILTINERNRELIKLWTAGD